MPIERKPIQVGLPVNLANVGAAPAASVASVALASIVPVDAASAYHAEDSLTIADSTIKWGANIGKNIESINSINKLLEDPSVLEEGKWREVTSHSEIIIPCYSSIPGRYDPSRLEDVQSVMNRASNELHIPMKDLGTVHKYSMILTATHEEFDSEYKDERNHIGLKNLQTIVRYSSLLNFGTILIP